MNINILNIKPNKDDVIILYYDMEEIPFDQLCKIMKAVKNEFPTNKSFALPDIMSLNTCDTETLLKLRDYINDIINCRNGD
jgi:hypothetical protein